MFVGAARAPKKMAQRNDSGRRPTSIAAQPVAKRSRTLARDLERWVAGGLITRDQADRIVAAETEAEQPEQRISLVAEALGYLGAALVGGRDRGARPGVERAVDRRPHRRAALYSALLLWARPEPLQHVAVYAGLVATAMGAVAVAGGTDSLPYGLVLWPLGVAWALLGRRGVLRPMVLTHLLGVFSALSAAQVVVADYRGWGLGLAIATTAVLFAASVALRAPIVLGTAVIGVFWFVPQSVLYFLGDALGVPLTLLVAGLVLLALAVALLPLRQRMLSKRPPAPPGHAIRSGEL